MSETSNAGEDPSASEIMDNPMPDIFYDASDLPPDDEIFQDKHYDEDGLYYFVYGGNGAQLTTESTA